MKTYIIDFKHLPILCTAMLMLVGCGQPAIDQAIKADITSKAKEDVNFAGVHFTVENGIVKLFGSCPTTTSRQLLKQKLTAIHVIDSVEDHLTIAPVILGSYFTLGHQVDSVLSNYPTVTASVSSVSVSIIGKISSSDLKKLLPSVKKIYPSVSTSGLKIIM